MERGGDRRLGDDLVVWRRVKMSRPNTTANIGSFSKQCQFVILEDIIDDNRNYCRELCRLDDGGAIDSRSLVERGQSAMPRINENTAKCSKSTILVILKKFSFFCFSKF
jgi:hypothetical protein